MKILIIHTKYQQYGGEDAVVKQELKLLSKYHEVRVIYFENKKGFKGALQFLFSIWNTNKAKIIKEEVINFSPQIVHIHNWHFALGPLFIRTIKKFDLKLVYTLHNYRLLCPSGVLFYNGEIYKKSLKRKFPWDAVLKGVYRKSKIQTFWLAIILWFHKKIKTFDHIDLFVCLADNTIKLINESNLKIQKRRLAIKPNFSFKVNNDTIDLNQKNGYIFLGRLSEEKGLKNLLMAFEKLTYPLRIIGAGPLEPLVKEAEKRFKHISYLGSLTKKEVALELKNTQVLIYPSICEETFGLSIIEAFSYYCPVISSNIGAPKTIINHNINGFHYESGSISGLIETIKHWESLNTQTKHKYMNNAYSSYIAFYTPTKQMDYFRIIYH